jgi:hypothetical protein
MLLPLYAVLKRGVVFLYPRFPDLSDPKLSGQTKPKYLVILSSSPLDDPVLYVLTTSEKPKHLTSPLKSDFMTIAGGKYSFLPKGTIVNVGEAGDLSFDREDLEELYESGELVYQGVLDEEDIAMLLNLIQSSLRVANRVKQILRP